MYMQTFEALPSSEQIVRGLEYNFPLKSKSLKPFKYWDSEQEWF